MSHIQHHFNLVIKSFETFSVYNSIILQFFNEIYYFIDNFAFDYLKSNGSSLSSSEIGIQIKLAVSQLESWKMLTLKKFSLKGVSLTNDIGPLSHLSQSAALMVVNKSILKDKEFVRNYFSSLNNEEIYYLLKNFSAKDKTELVPETILQEVYSWIK